MSVCLFVILVGVFFVQKANLAPFIPPSQPVPADETTSTLTPRSGRC